MSIKKYETDAYTTNFVGEILTCNKVESGYAVTLKETYFYPEGGGQPSDKGFVGNAVVLDVREKNEQILHILDRAVAVGDHLDCTIDWENRFDLMQNHSGEHILSGIICKQYNCNNVGFHMGTEKILIDFDAKIEEADIAKLEAKANEAIWTNTPILVTYPNQEELAEIDYRSKIEIDGQVRIVQAGEYDCCACCGTHVVSAGEIGVIKIIGIQSYKGGTRLEIVCGKRALLHYDKKNRSADEAGRMLSVSGEKVAGAVTNLLAEKDDLIQKLSKTKYDYFKLLAKTIPEGVENVAILGDGFAGKDLTNLADILVETTGGRAFVMSPTAEGFAFVLISKHQDANDYMADLKTMFSGKGGGKKEAVQGKLAGKSKDILAYWREKGFCIIN
ncbi:alanyl-tRNA editing protein [Chakrabartyella piscis]|uniref:alanyl-tRNA editing protein n=1 Tax=Chakrabartyella piscis TaxID=2918914 RepID=UPI0029585BA0|nr:alanyl-tRNA editing protein [Chakrabartyella piscis]